jgi:hypothetical protein
MKSIKWSGEQISVPGIYSNMSLEAYHAYNICDGPAEMVRERFDSGVLNTMAQVGYVELVDRDKLDMNKLRPYFKDSELLRALTQYAKATAHKKPMDGAIIEMRADTVIK